MSPPQANSAAADSHLRQTVRVPRDSDGVGGALRQIFGSVPDLPPEWRAMLGRLNDA